ncbi:hypothetical protein H8356DRAFT_1439002, partial [Neocallimastix lanati (nom. inval.)]
LIIDVLIIQIKQISSSSVNDKSLFLISSSDKSYDKYCASIVTAGRGIETQKGENSIGLHYLTKKNIFIREVRTIYTFNGKTVLTCKNNFKEIFRNIIDGQFVNPLINPWRFVFSDSNKLTLLITKVFGYRPGNNSSTFNVSTHEGAYVTEGVRFNWASGL